MKIAQEANLFYSVMKHRDKWSKSLLFPSQICCIEAEQSLLTYSLQTPQTKGFDFVSRSLGCCSRSNYKKGKKGKKKQPTQNSCKYTGLEMN